MKAAAGHCAVHAGRKRSWEELEDPRQMAQMQGREQQKRKKAKPQCVNASSADADAGTKLLAACLPTGDRHALVGNCETPLFIREMTRRLCCQCPEKFDREEDTRGHRQTHKDSLWDSYYGTRMAQTAEVQTAVLGWEPEVSVWDTERWAHMQHKLDIVRARNTQIYMLSTQTTSHRTRVRCQDVF